MYATRRYAACIRDLDYYALCDCTQCWQATHPSLDRRVLNGFEETTTPWVPLGATVQTVQAMKEVTASLVSASVAGKEMGVYFQTHLQRQARNSKVVLLDGLKSCRL
jgi:allophycocyanin beta subunit